MNKLAVMITTCLFVVLLLFSIPRSTPEISLGTKEQIDGNIRRVDYIDKNGVVTSHPTSGYATMVQIRDQDGHPVEEYYLDAQGNPVERSVGYYGIRRTYENNLCTQYTLLDQSSLPVNITSGCAAVKQVFNDEKKVSEVYYLDAEYQPVALKTGQYGEHREYNEDGKNYITIYTDADGTPMENKKGCSTIMRDYTPEGKIDVEWYYNLAGEKVDIGRGQYGSRRVYEDGVYIKSVPVDARGHRIFYFDEFLAKNPWLVGVAAITLVMLAIFLNQRQRVTLLTAYVLFILYMTLLVRETGEPKHNLELFWSYRQFLKDKMLGLEVLNNIWLFIPFGAMLCSMQRKPWMILTAVGLTVMIESTQYFFGLGLCELDDIIGNSLGAWLGWGCFCEGERRQMKKREWIRI